MSTLYVQYAFLIISHPLCLRMRNSVEKVVEKQQALRCSLSFLNHVFMI